MNAKDFIEANQRYEEAFKAAVELAPKPLEFEITGYGVRAGLIKAVLNQSGRVSIMYSGHASFELRSPKDTRELANWLLSLYPEENDYVFEQA